MKITAADLDKIVRLTGAEDSSGLRMALANHLIGIYDRGYAEAVEDQERREANSHLPYAQCPYTTMSHTKEWCGYEGCRES